MNRFRPLNDSVMLTTNGVYSEHQVYYLADQSLFARKGNGYIRLMNNHATSASKIFWSDLSIACHLITVRVGKLVLTGMINDD